MKVLDLACADGHRFEGWFASEDDFLEQNGRQAIACPVCATSVIVRRPSAPRIAVHRDAPAAGAPSTPAPVATVRTADAARAATMAALQSQVLRAVRQVLADTEDVGPRFAEEARRIHYGEAAERGIRGQASPQEAEALRDEGIEVMAIPLPKGWDGPLQ